MWVHPRVCFETAYRCRFVYRRPSVWLTLTLVLVYRRFPANRSPHVSIWRHAAVSRSICLLHDLFVVLLRRCPLFWYWASWPYCSIAASDIYLHVQPGHCRRANWAYYSQVVRLIRWPSTIYNCKNATKFMCQSQITENSFCWPLWLR